MLRGGLEDHQHIVQWLAEGEPELASLLVRRHIERTGSTLRRLLVSQPAPAEADGRKSVARRAQPSRTKTARSHAQADLALRTLPPRELAVLAQVAEGKSDDAIAAALDWPLVRVQRTLGSVFRTLGLTENTGVDRRVTAALMYLRAR